MNLKILMLLIMYWTFVGAFFAFGQSYLTGYSQTGSLTDMGNSLNQSTEGGDAGLFSSGINFGRFFALMLFGIGLPSTTPVWFSYLFAAWQTIISIFTIGFVMDSIWSG